jgi:hypothetical protein
LQALTKLIFPMADAESNGLHFAAAIRSKILAVLFPGHDGATDRSAAGESRAGKSL